MIECIQKVTLYVTNQQEAVTFWTQKLNFVILLEQTMGPNITWIEVAPSKNSKTSFVLYDKTLMKQQNPSANVEHPSVILKADDLESLYKDLKDNHVTVSEIMHMPYGDMFTFEDQDHNSYLVRS